MIRIGIDAHGVGGNSLGCGNESHFSGLIGALLRRDSKNEYHIFVNHPRALQQLAVHHPNARIVRLKPNSQWIQRPLSLPLYVNRYKIDVVHCPFVPPPFVKAARIITVHDIAFDSHPEWYTPVEATRMKIVVRNGCRIADRIFTVSNFAANQIRDAYKVPNNKLVITYNATDWPDIPLTSNTEPEPWGDAHFIFYLGLVQPRKNLVRLVKAFEDLVQQHDVEHHLVIAGKNGWKTSELDSTIRHSPVRDRIHRVGFIPAERAVRLMARAGVFVFPSLLEGFGIPVLEALHAGTPAVASSGSCFPEVFGDAIQYCDPSNPASIADAIRQVIQDDELRKQLVWKGKEKARAYSWDKTAAVVLDTYLECAEQNARRSRTGQVVA